MSERGSFVTEYIYCKNCFEVIKAEFFRDTDSKYFNPIVLNPYPIIAGKIGGSYASEELHLMEFRKYEIEPLLCHDVRVAVLAENGEEVITFRCFAKER